MLIVSSHWNIVPIVQRLIEEKYNNNFEINNIWRINTRVAEKVQNMILWSKKTRIDRINELRCVQKRTKLVNLLHKLFFLPLASARERDLVLLPPAERILLPVPSNFPHAYRQKLRNCSFCWSKRVADSSV